MKKKTALALALLAILSGCEMLPLGPGSQPVSRGSLLLIDEANQVLNRIDLSTLRTEFHSYLGPAANQILLDGDFAYLAVSLSHSILRINLAEGGAPLAYSWFGSPNPYMMALDNDYLYVSLAQANQLAVLDKTSLTLVTNLNMPAGDYPQGLAVDDSRIYIATSRGYVGWGDTRNYSNSQVVVLSKSSLSLLTNITVHTNPHQLLLVSNQLYLTAASHYDGSGRIQVLSTLDYTLNDVEMLPSLSPGYIYGDADGIYATDDQWSGSGGLYIWLPGSDHTNHLLPGTGLKGISSDLSNIYCSEAYGGDHVYIIRKTDWSISILSNTGGGDLALYQ